MNFFAWLKKYFKKLFGISKDKRNAEQPVEVIADELVISPEDITQQLEDFEQDITKFKLENIVLDKLNYLEQYIKTFSSSFPKEYDTFLSLINEQKREYEQELANYRKGLAGSITFSIDPERESKRFLAVAELENKINHFVDCVVSYSTYKCKFSTLCSKLNQFYNALVNCPLDVTRVRSQFTNATNTAKRLIEEVQKLNFFEHDSRKREDILSYVIYCDYLLFKIALRNSLTYDLTEYKSSLSQLNRLFVLTEYDRLIFQFFIQDLEQIQSFLQANLQNYESYDYMLESCNKLQTKMKDFLYTSFDQRYFMEIIKLENTLEVAAKIVGLDFIIPMPDSLYGTKAKDAESVNNIAISILKLINVGKARLLLEIVKSFELEISWKDFYFLCKIFDLYNEIVNISHNTVFDSVEHNFLELDKKYPNYSSSYIAEQKNRLLNYSGSKRKKYILLFPSGYVDSNWVTNELENLSLDYVVIDGTIYLNHSYFNGFATLERIFGNYITI